MKVTVEIPDKLHREVKAQAAREGLTVREVTVGMYETWLKERRPAGNSTEVDWIRFRPPLAHRVSKDIREHSMDAVRMSITENWNEPK